MKTKSIYIASKGLPSFTPSEKQIQAHGPDHLLSSVTPNVACNKIRAGPRKQATVSGEQEGAEPVPPLLLLQRAGYT